MMQIFRSLDEVRGIEASVVTIGKFDGIHLGHQKLIQTVVDLEAAGASTKNLKSVMVTFDRHPDAVLKPERAKLPLIGPTQKLALIESLGIDAVLVLPFTLELAAVTGEEFAKKVLVDKLHATNVLIGPDVRFGRGGACGLDELTDFGKELGFEAASIEPVMLEGLRVSTSAIRDALDSGDVALANQMFGRVHTTVGVVEHGLKIGRTIGFPTANLSRESEGYLPLDGVYAGWLIADGVRYAAAHSVGVNETFQAVPRLVESHVIDETALDLYDKVVTLEYVDFIRPSAKFNGVEDLVAEIYRDLDKVRTRLAS
jgi:riboflavin kinase/FMN adenylyltransferase